MPAEKSPSLSVQPAAPPASEARPQARATSNPALLTREAACLALLSRGRIELAFPIPRRGLILGRSGESDILVSDPQASKHHARILVQDRKFLLEDLDSRIGTRVNERKIKVHPLTHGDLVRIGRNLFVFLKPGMPPKRPTCGVVGWVQGKLPDARRINLPVTEDPIWIGQAEEAHIRLPGPEVADFQTQIMAVPGGAQITEVTSAPLRCVLLVDPCELTFGAVRLRYVPVAGRAAAEPPSSLSSAITPLPAAPPSAGASPGHVPSEKSLIRALEEESERLRRASDTPVPKATEPGHAVPLTPGRRRVDRCALTALSGPCQGKSFFLAGKPLLVGRVKDCQICLQDPGVSRHHARLVRAEGEAVIEDLSSHNGIFLNGRRVQRHPVKPGDKIRIGGSEFLVHL